MLKPNNAHPHFDLELQFERVANSSSPCATWPPSPPLPSPSNDVCLRKCRTLLNFQFSGFSPSEIIAGEGEREVANALARLPRRYELATMRRARIVHSWGVTDGERNLVGPRRRQVC